MLSRKRVEHTSLATINFCVFRRALSCKVRTFLRQIAKKSIKNLGGAIAYSDGAKMKQTLVSFYNAIGLNLVGGKLPEDDFYYEK